jgi:hypothetical protein
MNAANDFDIAVMYYIGMTAGASLQTKAGKVQDTPVFPSLERPVTTIRMR